MGGHWKLLEQMVRSRPPRPQPRKRGMLRVTPNAFTPLGPDRIQAICTYECISGWMGHSQRMADPLSEWTFVKEGDEWKIAGYKVKMGRIEL